MPADAAFNVEYLATTRLGEKGQLTVPKEYRDALGLEVGAPVAVLRIGNGLILVPEQARFRELCDGVAAVLTSRGVAAKDLQTTLPQIRRRLFVRRYPGLSKKTSTARTR